MEFDFEHLDAKWDKPRRHVVIRQEINKRPKAPGKQLSLFKDIEQWKEYRFSAYITNDRSTVAEEIWREYRPRATQENVIKDLKEGYGLAAFSMHNFWATEAMMVINALVFRNLMHYLNRHVLNANKPQQQLRTLRSHYFIIPAQLGSSGGYSVLRLGVKDKRLRGKIKRFMHRISKIPHRLQLRCS